MSEGIDETQTTKTTNGEVTVTTTEPTEQTISKGIYDKTAKELADYKKKWKATLDEAEQARIEKEEKEAELAELKKENSKMKLLSNLSVIGLDEKLTSKIAESAIEGDYESLASAIKKATEAKTSTLQAKIDELELEATQRPAQNSATGETDPKVDYAKMSVSELQALYEKSPELFAKD